MEGSISTPTDTGGTTTAPATFSDSSLSWTEDSSSSTPDQETTPAASASADATVPPADQTAPDGSTPTAGEPPKERWDTILANARAKAAEDAIAPYAWAKQVDPQEFQQIQRLAGYFKPGGDVVSGLQQLIAEARKDPGVDAQIRSFAAKTLAQRSQPQPEANQEPQFLVPQQDGSLAFDPTAFAQWKQWNQTQLLSQVDQRLQPLQQTQQAVEAERAALQAKQEIRHYTESELSSAAKWKGMEDKAFRAKVGETLSRLPVNSDDPRDVSLAFREAYRMVRDADDQQSTQRAEAGLLDSLKRKAAASTSVNPGSAAASSPRAVTRFSDLPPEAWK